jgi:hypothetical protein
MPAYRNLDVNVIVPKSNEIYLYVVQIWISHSSEDGEYYHLH